jgi:hypothetical protein
MSDVFVLRVGSNLSLIDPTLSAPTKEVKKNP